MPSYYTISKSSKGEFKDRGSKFIAYADNVEDEASCLEFLEKIRKEHFKARHHCFAYRIGSDGVHFRSNDDGEPSGTAGNPILGQIDKFNLTNIIIVVVRYFGGTKLGTSGLIKAYREAAFQAIEANTILQKHEYKNIYLSFQYEKLGVLMEYLKQINATIYKKEFGERPTITLKIEDNIAEEEIRVLKSKLLKRPLEDITNETSVPDVKITIVEP
jgi:uncharacterized YigZ family protein